MIRYHLLDRPRVEFPGSVTTVGWRHRREGGRNAEADSRGERRSNETHASTTDPDAKLYRRGPGQEAKLADLGHALMENRSGLLVDACVTRVSGHAERVAALAMIEAHADRPCSITLGADRGWTGERTLQQPARAKSDQVASYPAAEK